MPPTRPCAISSGRTNRTKLLLRRNQRENSPKFRGKRSGHSSHAVAVVSPHAVRIGAQAPAVPRPMIKEPLPDAHAVLVERERKTRSLPIGMALGATLK